MNDAKKRFEEQLAQWFKVNEAKGYSEDSLKLYLIEHGYHALDITEAITSFRRPAISVKKKYFDFKNFNYKKFFMPTFLKLFLPGALLLLVLLSFIVNSLVYPKIGNLACQETELQKQQQIDAASLSSYSMQLDADPGLLIGIINNTKKDQASQDALYSKNTRTFRTVALTDFYLYNSGIYHLNFLFPVPCNTDNAGTAMFCYNYYSEATTGCLANFALDADTSQRGVPVGFFVYLINALLLIAILYVLACIFVYLLEALEHLNNERKMMIIAAIALLLIISIVIGSSFLITLMIIMLLFAGMIYVKGIEFKELLLAMFAFILLIFMFILFFVANTKEIPSNGAYSIMSHNCNTTASLSPDEILVLLHSEFPLNTTLSEYYLTDITADPYYQYSQQAFNVCTDCNADCTSICQAQGQSSVNPYSLRGANPSCVCTCQTV